MKRFLLAAVLTLTATGAFARGEDVLITPDGTVFKVEEAMPSSIAKIEASSFLALSIQRGNDDPQYIAVPDSLKAGYNSNGTLAYDADTQTLFVLWVHAPNAMSSELWLAAYRNGVWQPAIAIDNQAYRIRTNLQLGVTRRISKQQKDGSYADAPALLLHALWWEESGTDEQARYALLTVEKGVASVADIHSLEEFVSDDSDATANGNDTAFNKDLLRHPAIVSSPSQSSVDVVFGDTKTNTIHTARFTPVAESRIHIPVGIGGGNPGGGRGIRGPRSISGDWTGSVTVLAHGDNLVFANQTASGISYVMYSDGKWSDVKTIATGLRLSNDAAMAAIGKMLTAQ